MCNACGNLCCGSDQFEGCGCDGCREPECHTDLGDCGPIERDGFCDAEFDDWSILGPPPEFLS